jgi:hypothetical protein
MRKRFEYITGVDAENREAYIKSAWISSSNDQWDEEVKKHRGANRPAMTFNLLNLVVKQIIGDYRQNKMAISVLPAGGVATEESAEIIAGLIRHIERDSKAEESYTNGLECSARGNIGYFRVVSDYEQDEVAAQKLLIKPVKNPLTVYCDPAAKRVDRSDARYYLITEIMSKEEFKQLYPEAEENGWDIVDTSSDDLSDWGDDEQIRICEYFTKETRKVRLVLFDNGATIEIDNDEEIKALESINIHKIKERMVDRPYVKWRKCTGTTILEEADYKIPYIPIIPVLGEEVNLEGKTALRSAIYYAIDAQHSYNYERSASIERSALAAKAPWLVTQKQIELWRAQWDNANTTPQPYLIFTPDERMPTGPQRIEPPAASSADVQNSQNAAQDVQRTTGVFDSQVGAKTNVLSGVGLSEQQSQGVTSTFVFLDNLRAAIEFCGRILVDWIPQIYDSERTIRIINAEGDVEMIKINQNKQNPVLGVTEVLNDITLGKYDVIVTAGKAFASRRQESVEAMLKWAQSFPQQAPLIADQILENMDVPGGEVMAARIKRSLPPQVVDDPDSPEGQQAAQAAAQQQQQQQMMLQSHMQLQQGKQQAEMAKTQATMVKAQAEVVKAHADTQTALIQAHAHQGEQAAQVLDNTRMQPVQAQPAIQLEVKKSPEDAQRDNEIHQGISAIAEHLALAHHENTSHARATHELLGHVAQSLTHGHQAIAEQMKRQNELAAVPTVAVRDKTGRIVGSRKDV